MLRYPMINAQIPHDHCAAGSGEGPSWPFQCRVRWGSENRTSNVGGEIVRCSYVGLVLFLISTISYDKLVFFSLGRHAELCAQSCKANDWVNPISLMSVTVWTASARPTLFFISIFFHPRLLYFILNLALEFSFFFFSLSPSFLLLGPPSPLTSYLFDTLCYLRVLFFVSKLKTVFYCTLDDGMRYCKSDWPGLCLFFCSQPLWVDLGFCLFQTFSNFTPPPHLPGSFLTPRFLDRLASHAVLRSCPEVHSFLTGINPEAVGDGRPCSEPPVILFIMVFPFCFAF